MDYLLFVPMATQLNKLKMHALIYITHFLQFCTLLGRKTYMSAKSDRVIYIVMSLQCSFAPSRNMPDDEMLFSSTDLGLRFDLNDDDRQIQSFICILSCCRILRSIRGKRSITEQKTYLGTTWVCNLLPPICRIMQNSLRLIINIMAFLAVNYNTH